MKKTLILSLGMLAVLASCKKSSSTPPESANVSISLDGSAKSFNTTVTATKQRVGSSTVLTIIGVGSPATTLTESFTLMFNNSPSLDSITARTYTDTTARFTVEAMYKPDFTSQNYYDAGSSFMQLATMSGVKVANHLVVAITSIDAQSVKGTFSGDFYYRGDPSSTKKTVTNGSFYAKFN